MLFLHVIKIAKIYKDAILVHHRVFYEMMSLSNYAEGLSYEE